MTAIFPALLTVHLIAFAFMAGTTVIEFINYRTFWKLFNDQKEQAAAVLAATAKFSKLIGIGAALLILTGAGMIALTHGLLAQQLWLKIKLVLVVLLILNGVLNGNKIAANIRKAVDQNAPDQFAHLTMLKGKMQAFYLLQLIILFIIVFLAAYKFM
jgi:uncharacterized membrane protein